MDLKRDVTNRVQNNFGARAEEYVNSATHRLGEDLTLLLKWLGPASDAIALDVATGGGHVAKNLAPLVGRVVASDLTKEMLASAKQHIQSCGIHNIDYIVADAECLPFLDASFDIVTCRIAAHHFPNPTTFISEVSRVLKPNGKFLFIDNVSPNDSSLAEYLNTFEKLRDSSHVRCLSVDEWSDLFSQHGLTVLQERVRKKTADFLPWLRRMTTSIEQEKQVEDYICRGSASALEYFSVAIADGRVTTLAIDEWMVMASKLVGGKTNMA